MNTRCAPSKPKMIQRLCPDGNKMKIKITKISIECRNDVTYAIAQAQDYYKTIMYFVKSFMNQ